ncbi:S-layer homology domain-containing protein [Paenibacillus sp. 32352]|uniref:S-layer homology domain-containing protein n=1 Tax=Paenibacillus sp. 32352 TaxID=1969111 RepID=UPI0015C4504C|nr:S-layer homology domain-containing protein [Paenibacillus sp. 32352]
MKRLQRCLIFLMMLVWVWPILPQGIRAETPPVFSLEASTSTTELDREFTVTLKGSGQKDLYGYEAIIEYDASKLNFIEQKNGMNGSGFSMGPIHKDNVLTFAYTKVGKGVAGESGDVTLSRLTFKTKAAGTASVKLVKVTTVSSKETESIWTGASSVSVVIGGDGGNPSNPGTGGRRGGGSVAVAQPQMQSDGDGVRIVVNPMSQTVKADGKSVAVAALTDEILANAVEALKANPAAMNTIHIDASNPLTAVRVDIPGTALAELIHQTGGVILSIQYNEARYDLPVRALKLDQWVASLQAELKDVKVSILIEKISGAAGQPFSVKAGENDLKLVTEVYDFTITAESGGKTITAEDFGDTYVSRLIEVASPVNYGKTTGVWFDPSTGELKFVPTFFHTDGSHTTATIKRPGNSMYALVEHSRAFADLSGHWARQDIEMLASKLVVSGRTDQAFVPEERITRAEFAALLVRGLGLSEREVSSFHDVTSKDWFAGSVGAANKAGLVDGIAGDRFAPNDHITREQMAAMMSRALKLAGKATQADLKSLEMFHDEAAISSWAREAAALSVTAGFMNGQSPSSFAPNAAATRAEATVVLKRMLQYIEFIN